MRFRRLAVTSLGAALVVAAFASAEALAAAPTALAAFASLVLALPTMLIVGSLMEWWVHGHLMHTPGRGPIRRFIYALHHRAHHWTHYRPDAYHQDAVTYVPVVPPRPERACRTRGESAIAVLGQALFYGAFVGPPGAIAWPLTHNLAFALGLTAGALVLVGLAVHLHDALHCPGHSPFERFAWFRRLDRHHYIHHVDTRVNVNLVLPFGDLLLGTLKRELTDAERGRWPSYEEAVAVVHPSCATERDLAVSGSAP